MMDYNNPNNPWMHTGYDPYKGLDEDERMLAGCLQAAGFISGIVIAFLLCLLFSSCTTTQYVPVVQTHEQHHWHTDSVKEKDSIYHENTTIIQQLDSAAMAKYGIQLKTAERAWLVKTAELERQIQQLSRLTQYRDTVRDSVPAPYPVVKEVPAKMSQWQKWLMWIGLATVLGIIVLVMVKVRRFLPGM